ncbi:CRISPR/Cas system associated [Sulfolobus spindle-shaped virus 2]|uniref:Fuselloviral Cas4 protein SSV2p22 n=2 Tax=root TaxID=1 RepID=A0A157SYJ0_SACSO|nr:Dna2/Cas4 domain-containing protein [Saccharolobus solfataricus]NP_944474.1 CRISPR/Cas system associated [Sulfolobus spindle-shaped virus 2]AAQ73269.1 ORF 205 [Sulfolobus spindle-shaped virus 2]SAI84243.1 Fuselloviral Cas4 protein SSV2p22 [Saccharolobus solfataricus]
MSRLLTIIYNYEIVSNDTQTIWVTELTRCLRRSWLMRKNGKVKLSHYEIMKMHIGTGLHMRLQRILQKNGFETEVKVQKKTALGFIVVGKIDVYDKEEGTVYELKYTHLDELDRPRLNNYLRQLNYYIEMANALAGYLIIVHADGRVEEIKRDWAETDLEARANAFGISVEENILPPRKSKQDSECAECPFYNFCWRGDRNGVRQ